MKPLDPNPPSTQGTTTRIAVALACLFSLALPAFAQPGESLDLAIAERRAADKSLSIHERELAADRALELRNRLIAEAPPDEPRLPGWLMDQAAATLAALGRDGSDTAVIFGIPLPAQRQRVAQAAADANDTLDRAARLISASAAELTEAGIGPADPRAAALEQERTVRIPFFRARALVLLAACATGEQRARHAQAAVDAVGTLALASPGPEASRRVNFSAALLLRGSDPADAQTAANELGTLVRTGAAAQGVHPAARAEAWLALATAGIMMGNTEAAIQGLRLAAANPPFLGPDGRPDTLLVVLAADTVARALFERAARTGDATLLDLGAEQLTSLMARTDLALRPESLRPLVFEKLAILAAGVGSKLPLPPAAQLGRAIVQARDPARRADSLAAFQKLADRPDAGPFAADALWEWAVILTQSPASDRAARRTAADVLLRLAREFPSSPVAAEAMSAALAYARALALEAAPGQDAADVYTRALSLATESYPNLPNTDLWRYERARLLSQSAAAPEADLAAAAGLLALIPASSTLSADADRLMERISTLQIDRLRTHADDLRRAGDDESLQRLAKDRLAPAAKRASEWAAARLPPSAPRFRLDLADALTDAGDPGGRKIYEQLLPGAADLPGGTPRVRVGLARALLLAGEREAAFVHLRDVAAALDGPTAEPGAPARPASFWHAWSLMLGLLADENTQGARSGTIRAHIKRLEAIDPEFGGEPWRRRIRRIRDDLGA